MIELNLDLFYEKHFKFSSHYAQPDELIEKIRKEHGKNMRDIEKKFIKERIKNETTYKRRSLKL